MFSTAWRSPPARPEVFHQAAVSVSGRVSSPTLHLRVPVGGPLPSAAGGPPKPAAPALPSRLCACRRNKIAPVAHTSLGVWAHASHPRQPVQRVPIPVVRPSVASRVPARSRTAGRSPPSLSTAHRPAQGPAAAAAAAGDAALAPSLSRAGRSGWASAAPRPHLPGLGPPRGLSPAGPSPVGPAACRPPGLPGSLRGGGLRAALGAAPGARVRPPPCHPWACRLSWLRLPSVVAGCASFGRAFPPPPPFRPSHCTAGSRAAAPSSATTKGL